MSMPTLFVSHGSPMLHLEEGLPGRAFLASLGSMLPRPKAIVAVSAHWNTERPAVSLTARPETIHDFYGFPEPLYRLRYEAPGAPELAERVAQLTGAARAEYGLDHGAWVPALLAWPAADIPIFQLSIQPYSDPAHHIALGRALAQNLGEAQETLRARCEGPLTPHEVCGVRRIDLRGRFGA